MPFPKAKVIKLGILLFRAHLPGDIFYARGGLFLPLVGKSQQFC